jgi:hypothetical protein
VDEFKSIVVIIDHAKYPHVLTEEPGVAADARERQSILAEEGSTALVVVGH